MKNICFLNGDMSRSGGTERVTAIIANELSKSEDKFKIHILSTTNEENKSYFKLNKNIIQNRILDKKEVNFKKEYFKIVNGIRNYIKKNNIDILIDVDVISDIFSVPATRFTKTKLISWEHFNYYENNGTNLRSIARRLSGIFSDKIITLTERDKINYEEKVKRIDKVDYIYNPIDINEKEQCDINSKQIVSVGRLTYQKGFDMLCDVAKKVLNTHKDWKWIILGEGEGRQGLERKIKEYSLEDRLILAGNVFNVEDYYKNSSIFVMTSRFEGLPMTLLEAKSYGLPIISFDCLTGPSDIVIDKFNGYLIKANNISDMSNRICELIENNEMREEFSKKAKYDIEKFNLNKIIDKWITIVEEL